MIYNAANSAPIFSSSRHIRRSRQTQSHPRPISQSTTLEGIRKRSSLRLPGRLSFNLVSVITKFEALDALSGDFESPRLKPAPLRLPTKKRASALPRPTVNAPSKLSPIVSPRSESVETQAGGTKKNEYRSKSDIFNSTSAGKQSSLDRTTNTDKTEGVQNSDEAINIQFRGIVWDPAEILGRRDTGAVAAPYVDIGYPFEKQKASIRDKISFFDGSISTGNSTPAKPSFDNVGAQPPSLQSHPESDQCKNIVTPSTRNLDRTLVSPPQVDAVTPTEASRFSVAQQHLMSGAIDNITSAFSSPCKASLASTTPRTWNSDLKKDTVQDNSPSGSQIRSRRLQGPTDDRRKSVYRKRDQSVLGDGSPSKVPRAVIPDNSSKPLSRVALSDKIEQLYRANEKERELRVTQSLTKTQVPQQQTVGKFGASSGRGNDLPQPSLAIRPVRRESKVSAMRKMFDERFGTKPPPVKLSPIRQRHISTAAAHDKQQEKVVAGVGVYTPRTFSPVPQVADKTLASPFPKPVHQSLIHKAKTMPFVKAIELQRTESPKTKDARLRSKTVVDRVKLFEGGQEMPQKLAQPSRRRAFTRKLNKSLRGLFEGNSRKSPEIDGSTNANADNGGSALPNQMGPDLNDPAAKLGPRNSIVGRWNQIPQSPPRPMSSGGDGASSDREYFPNVEEDVVRLVVKAVDCGLREPRPVRAIEMKRMVLLCRERVGEMMDKEKGDKVGPKKQH